MKVVYEVNNLPKRQQRLVKQIYEATTLQDDIKEMKSIIKDAFKGNRKTLQANMLTYLKREYDDVDSLKIIKLTFDKTSGGYTGSGNSYLVNVNFILYSSITVDGEVTKYEDDYKYTIAKISDHSKYDHRNMFWIGSNVFQGKSLTKTDYVNKADRMFKDKELIDLDI